MKCQYCGNNLGIEDEKCPYCGKENSQASKYIDNMKNYKEDYDKAKETSSKRVRLNSRTARMVVIAIMVMIAVVMIGQIKNYSDFDAREKRKEAKIAKEISKNKDEMIANLQEMEERRDYLAMKYYSLNYQLSHYDEFSEFRRVFTAADVYDAVYMSIINIITGYERQGETNKDWCNSIALNIDSFELYAEGEFWHDTADSPMHKGEHGAFIADAKKDIQDMVQVYFELPDEQAEAIWDMEQTDLASMLYEISTELYPEGNADEE